MLIFDISNPLTLLLMLAVTVLLIFLAQEVKKSMIVAGVLFVSFFSYLWVDDIETKKLGKKSLDDSLDWFWKKV